MNRAAPRARALLLLLLAGCAANRHEPTVPYRGIILDTGKAGGPVLERQMAADATVRDHVAREGRPDFVLLTSAEDTQIVYVRASQLVHFHRDAPGTASVAAVVTPLPSPLLWLLPASLFAGTPTPDEPVPGGCWRTIFPAGRCQTCCTAASACATDCRRL